MNIIIDNSIALNIDYELIKHNNFSTSSNHYSEIARKDIPYEEGKIIDVINESGKFLRLLVPLIRQLRSILFRFNSKCLCEVTSLSCQYCIFTKGNDKSNKDQ